MAKLTLKELAAALNLSTSTVSKALNDSYEISKKTKDRVRRYADQFNFQPNPLAKNLKLGKTNTIGAILPSIRNPFTAQLVEGLHEAALANNYNLIVMQSQDSEEIEEKALKTLVHQGMDGILISPAHEQSNHELISRIHKRTCPVVIFDRINYTLDTHKVGLNSIKSVYDATRQLISIGRSDIVILCGKNIGVTSDRLKGYIKALEEEKIIQNPDYIVHTNYNNSLDGIDKDLKQKLQDLLHSETPPNAIIGTTDTLTTRVLGVLAELNVSVPQEIAVIGFANTDIANSLNPALSTIKQPTKEMAKLAVEKVLDLITTKRERSQIEYECILLDATIQLRKSTQV